MTKKIFLFKTEVYSPDEILRLRGVCEKDYGKFAPMMVRAGTEDEWRIVQGLVEGTIIAKQLPQFVKRIMKIDEQVRLVHTIRAQFEGCVVMDLRGESPIKEAFLSTKCIQESIATAAATRGSGSVMLWRMVVQVKIISYDGGNHALYFHFFTNDMASKFVGVKVPFHRYDHSLRNLHQETTTTSRSAWETQVDSNGESYEHKGFYSCVLKNITRSVGLLKLSGYLRKILGVNLQLDHLKKSGPFSDTSTLWELIVESDACPTALMAINSIYWGQTMLVVEHPAMRGKRQCLRCGEAGHPMRKCTASLEELLKSNCLQVKLEDFKKYMPPATTFRSMEELRAQVEAVRIQQEHAQIKAALKDEEGEVVESGDEIAPTGLPQHENLTRSAADDGPNVNPSSSESSQPSHESSAWVTVQKKKKRRGVRFQTKGVVPTVPSGASSYTSSLKMNLEKSRKDENTQNRAGPTSGEQARENAQTENKKVSRRAVGTKTSQSDQSESVRKVKKSLHNKKVEIFQKKTSAFLMLEGKVRTFMANVLERVEMEDGPITVARPRDDTDVGLSELSTIQDVVRLFNFRSIPTPVTGNCQIYAVCQGLTCSERLYENASLLEDMTKQLKEGCLARALMDFDVKFPPGVRISTLIELRRGDCFRSICWNLRRAAQAWIKISLMIRGEVMIR